MPCYRRGSTTPVAVAVHRRGGLRLERNARISLAMQISTGRGAGNEGVPPSGCVDSGVFSVQEVFCGAWQRQQSARGRCAYRVNKETRVLAELSRCLLVIWMDFGRYFAIKVTDFYFISQCLGKESYIRTKFKSTSKKNQKLTNWSWLVNNSTKILEFTEVLNLFSILALENHSTIWK